MTIKQKTTKYNNTGTLKHINSGYLGGTAF